MKSIFLSFCHSYLDLSHDFLAHICFHSHFFTAHTSLGCRKGVIGMLFDGKPDNLLSRTLYWTRVAAHVILRVREDVMNYVLFSPLSNYREGVSKLTCISNKTLSRIKAESEKVVLAKPSDFNKCEICINCKITHKQDNRLYITKKRSLSLGFEPLSLHYSSKIYIQCVCAPYRLRHEAI